MGLTPLCSSDKSDQQSSSDIPIWNDDDEWSVGKTSFLKVTTFLSDNFFEDADDADFFFSDEIKDELLEKEEFFFWQDRLSSVFGGRVGVELEYPVELRNKVKCNWYSPQYENWFEKLVKTFWKNYLFLSLHS